MVNIAASIVKVESQANKRVRLKHAATIWFGNVPECMRACVCVCMVQGGWDGRLSYLYLDSKVGISRCFVCIMNIPMSCGL